MNLNAFFCFALCILCIRTFSVYAKTTVSCAGSLHTPAIMLRSGLTNPKIGKHLTLHPVVAVAGYYPEETTQLGSGVSMGVLIQPPSLAGKLHEVNGLGGYGLVIETPPVHPGIFGLIIPWVNPLDFKAKMLLWSHFAASIGISRDHSCESNRIAIDKEGNPIIHYEITSIDKKLLVRGIQEQLKIFHHHGAQVLVPIHESFPWFIDKKNLPGEHESSDEEAWKQEFDSYLKLVEKEGIQPSRTQIFSAHQMSSCRMSASPDQGPIRPTGESWECLDFFVADGSVFPTALGINPMITIAAIAHYVAGEIKSRLQASSNHQ